MKSLAKYFHLMKERPDLFRYSAEPGEIKIITEPLRIRIEQRRLQDELRAQGNPIHWVDIGMLSEDKWFWVLRDLVEFPDGKIGGYIRFINRMSNDVGGFNVILICVQNNRILLIRKFRHEERNWSWEFPRGFGEPNLSAEENARKEMLEEIGISPSQLILLTEIRESRGGTAVFYADIALGQEITLDVGEGIANYNWVTLTELREIVKQGKLSDWFSLWAYTLANINHLI
jgi:ADP-ribose pyrophosphatase